MSEPTPDNLPPKPDEPASVPSRPLGDDDSGVPLPEPAQRALAELGLRRPPFWMVVLALLVVVVTWVPLVFIARARVTTSDKPRVHLFQDMDVQPKYRPQGSSELFADGRAMRPAVPGTVARGEVIGDDHFTRGYTLQWDEANQKWQLTYLDGLPEKVKASRAMMLRGQQQFNIYCAACHGLDGYGEGPVHLRATELEEPAWVPPTSMHIEAVRDREDGHLYNTITNGIRNMPGYGGQIDIEDRWAIVLYIRALQRSQYASLEDVPAAQRDSLR